MLRRRWPQLLAAALATSGCEPPQKGASSTDPQERSRTPPASRPAQRVGQATPSSGQLLDDADSQRAAKILKAYFAFLEAGKTEEAWKLRWVSEVDDENSHKAFSGHFKQYSSYRATVGQPGQVLTANGSSFVEIPVQVYGQLKDGSPVSTAGTISMRRKGDTGWRVYSRD